MGNFFFRTREFPRSGSKAKDGENTPWTAGGPCGQDRTLDVKSRKIAEKSTFFLLKKNLPQKIFVLHISPSHAKILGEKLFRTWEIPRSGSKAEDGEKREVSEP